MNTKFGQILSICSQDIEQKLIGDVIQGPYLETLKTISGNIPKLDPVNVDAHTKFGQILSIRIQDIE